MVKLPAKYCFVITNFIREPTKMKKIIPFLALLVAMPALSQELSSNSSATLESFAVQVFGGDDADFNLTQSLDITTITAANAVSCNDMTSHADNSYLRRFDLDGEFGITDDFAVSSVDFGVESSTSAGGTTPVSVNIYSIPAGADLLFANLTLINSVALDLADVVGGAIISTAIEATLVDPVANDLVLEIFTPDAAADLYFMGSNTGGETAPSFIAAADCGIAEPAATGDIGFPTFAMLMIVNGSLAGPDIEFPPPPVVPTLNVYGILAMTLLLLIGGAFMARRRA